MLCPSSSSHNTDAVSWPTSPSAAAGKWRPLAGRPGLMEGALQGEEGEGGRQKKGRRRRRNWKEEIQGGKRDVRGGEEVEKVSGEHQGLTVTDTTVKYLFICLLFSLLDSTGAYGSAIGDCNPRPLRYIREPCLSFHNKSPAPIVHR